MNAKARTLIPFVLAFVVTATAVGVAAQTDGKMQYMRSYSQKGVNVFEAPSETEVPFNGLAVGWGAAFTQQMQGLDHSNEPGGLIELGTGFNTATANLNLDVQLADGIRVNVITYMSSRHHPEAWVKGGYIQADKLTVLNNETIDRLMENLTIKVGHFEINYGDAHFRRSDNGNVLYNPFVGNLIMDAFNTEIGAEVYYRNNGWLAMAAVTGGEIKGSVDRPDGKSPSYYGKVGYDSQINTDLRLRLTGSAYTTSKSLNNTLFSGDRGGSRYYLVLEEEGASTSSKFTSGRFNPGLRSKVTALVFNPFIKFKGLEVFGNIEQAKGQAANETADRTWNQYAGEVLYRFFEGEKAYVGGRFNTVSGELAGSGADVSIDRMQVGAGWFVTENILIKAEYVDQAYDDFPAGDLKEGGGFDGFMLESTVAF
ncbi:MAG: hypothetical protein GKR89_29230 [Candidatus Latescibacteria bacterium]|nr:hypothetical protein [Candidatus Latescibacterota bacterium]